MADELDKYFKSRHSAPRINDMLELIVENFGGTDKLVKAICATAKHAASDAVRWKAMDAILRLVTKNEELNPPADLEEMSDTELEELRQSLVKQLNQRQEVGYIVDATRRTTEGTPGGEETEGGGPSSVSPAAPSGGIPRIEVSDEDSEGGEPSR